MKIYVNDTKIHSDTTEYNRFFGPSLGLILDCVDIGSKLEIFDEERVIKIIVEENKY